MSCINKKSVFWKRVGTETVLLNVDTGFYYTLAEVGGRIWEMLVVDCNEEQIATAIAQEYGVKEQRVSQDLQDLIKELKKEKILSVT
jgi:hypothetical protein